MKKISIILGLLLCFSACSYCSEIADKEAVITEIGTMVNQKKIQLALKKCNEAIELYPQESVLYYWRAVILNAKGDRHSALKDYDKSISLNPENSKLYVMRGICKYNLKDEKGALADYNKAIELDKYNSSAYSMRAMIRLENGDFDGASEDLNKANTIFEKAHEYMPDEKIKEIDTENNTKKNDPI